MRRVAVLVLAVLIAAVAAADVRVQLHLKRRVSEAAIEAEFQARTTPGSPYFRQHMTLEQLTAFVSAEPEAADAVERYFAGVRGVKHQRFFLTRDVFAAEVASSSPAVAALGIPASAFSATSSRRALAVPAPLAPYVERITVVPSRDRRAATERSARLARGSSGEPGAQQTPASIKARYSIPDVNLPSSVVQGVGEFQQSYFDPSWITTFSAKYNLTNPTILRKGPNAQSSDDLEGTLDLEYITGLAPGATTWWISSNDTGPDPYGIDFAWWSNEVMQLSPMPTVVSLSWGIGEDKYYGNEGVLLTDNDGFRKLGLLGVTVLAASGDTGPGSRGFVSCSHFDPSWPASSPYLTSVGATYANDAASSEVAVSFSGGGFSDYFAAPSYQQPYTQKYLATASGLPNSTFYNATGRGFPDVAALGTNFMVFGPGQFGGTAWEPVSGTSCAAPTFAAVLTRVNAHRVAAGKPTLGFINPMLYKLGKVGFDVTSGTNQDPDCFGFDFGGFTAAAGWDPVSGLGTPNFEYLVANL